MPFGLPSTEELGVAFIVVACEVGEIRTVKGGFNALPGDGKVNNVAADFHTFRTNAPATSCSEACPAQYLV